MRLFNSSQELNGKIEAINRSQAVIEFNLDGTIVTANPNFLDTLGYRLEEIQGKHHAYSRRRNIETARRIGSSGTPFAEASARRASMSASRAAADRSESRAYNPVYDADGKVCKVVKFAIDTTKQVQDRIQRGKIQKSIDADLSQITQAVTIESERVTSAKSRRPLPRPSKNRPLSRRRFRRICRMPRKRCLTSTRTCLKSPTKRNRLIARRARSPKPPGHSRNPAVRGCWSTCRSPFSCRLARGNVRVQTMR